MQRTQHKEGLKDGIARGAIAQEEIMLLRFYCLPPTSVDVPPAQGSAHRRRATPAFPLWLRGSRASQAAETMLLRILYLGTPQTPIRRP
jgi:hypothetical protein